MPPKSTTERGFGDYIEFTDGYGNEVTVRESSACSIDGDGPDGKPSGPWVWIFIEGEAHLRENPRPFVGISHGIAKASQSTHMTVYEARETRNALDEWIRDMEDQCDWLDAEPMPREVLGEGSRFAGKTKDEAIEMLELRLAQAHMEINRLSAED